eukprot:CAMPEP_0196135920 /NCGR_PEP_ID=MMETSP0910-20130528/4395_1 /TAXON_ID=49265 /ORGANISM="Thalassiosira rotula, Strain GSO102" /LENGTH=571 /DNA_ID=CAMNT_0041396125 /DNA_START=302 /DNA_END=2014 /DNA_ORIENTATION=+
MRNDTGNRLNSNFQSKRRASKDPPDGSSMLSHNCGDSTSTVHHKGNRSPFFDGGNNIKPKVASKRVKFARIYLRKDTTEAPSGFLEYKGKGFRRDYSLGVTARCLSHMIIDRTATPEQVFQSIDELKALDFAFIKNSEGLYSYAILACRTLEPLNNTRNSSSRVLEECMVFLVSDAGSTVKLRKSRWVECVRLVSVGGSDPVSNRRSAKRPNQTKLLRNTEVQLLRNNTYRSGGDWVPPNVISYPSTSRTGESESLIPSPSLHFILLPHLHKLFHVPEISSNANEKRKMGSNRSTSFRSTDAVSPVESVMVREMVVQLCDVAAMRSNASTRLNPKSPPKRRAFKDLPVGSPMLSHANGNIATRILSHANDNDGTSLNSDDSTATVHHKGHRFQPLDDDASIIEPKVASKRITFGLLHPENDTVEASPAFLKYRGRGFRRDYSLGVTALCPSHIIDRAATPDEAFQSINKLKALDFAFVKTPDGSYSYAILACRTLEPPIDSMNSSSHVLEEFMIFVVSNSGSTVKLRKSRWVEYVRLVSVEGPNPVYNKRGVGSPNQAQLLRNTKHSGGDW